MHTLVLTVDGDVYAFGDNGYGQCGNVTEHVQALPNPKPDPDPDPDPNPNPNVTEHVQALP